MMSIQELAQALHEINVLEMTGNPGKAAQLVEKVNAKLNDFHVAISWVDDSKEWVIVDTLLFEREEGDE